MNTEPPSPELDSCGCCEGLAPQTPIEIYNRAGLRRIHYRIGTHGSFKRTLLARLSGLEQSELRKALQRLNTRENDDFSIALLDAWALVGDVLTFYQEQIANEQFLPTAQERFSLRQLAHLIGYELRPGVAASVYLAFSLEETPGTPGQLTPGLPEVTTIPVGTKAQSVPEASQQPQTFETIEAIEARREWNTIRVRQFEPHPVSVSMPTLTFQGLPGLKPGDALLIPIPGQANTAFFRVIATVIPDPQKNATTVRLVASEAAAITVSGLSGTQPQPPAPGSLVQKYNGQEIEAKDLEVIAQKDGFQIRDLFNSLRAFQPSPRTAFVLRARSGIFGHNAPRWSSLPFTQRDSEAVYKPDAANKNLVVTAVVNGPYNGRENTWVDPTNADAQAGKLVKFAGATSPFLVSLDGIHSDFAAGSPVILVDGSTVKAYTILTSKEVTAADFTLSAKVTQLSIATKTGLESLGIRTTTAYGAPEELPLLPVRLSSNVENKLIDLEGWVEGLAPGRLIMLCGELADEAGINFCEPATLRSVKHNLSLGGRTVLELEKNPAKAYRRESVAIYANVARGTHGETRQEVLGSGDASQQFQSFTLRQPPLTYIKAETPSGAQSTLEVRVNDILWHEVENLEGAGPNERVYVTQPTEDGSVSIHFGDGVSGARLPTGQENVTANYRRGIGFPGLVKAGGINLLMTRPPGVRSVQNPLSAEGEADPESPDQARRNAPLTVLTLDRIVSLRDYEDFARSFSGVEKALASWSWSGQRRKIFLTVAGSQGADIPPGSQTLDFLLKAMRKAGDPLIPIEAQSYQKGFFKIGGQVKIHPDQRSATVLGAVEKSLRSAFSFDARQLGQPVTVSEVIAAVQGVEGVVAVNITRFHRSLSAPEAKPPKWILSYLPVTTANGMTPAELLTLDPGPLDDLGEMA